ncbi:Actin-related protein 2/3 complex subunit 4 [Zea mays]|uniref:Actin-related protein 2/3 complex subunit 4 n=1 Tax=Zea mays TaxID=4577 RepID=A0A1D6GDA1_MAIZE|nr:Actin-related protein 2/3 complex subunit 4 [Zea mays]
MCLTFIIHIPFHVDSYK